MKMKLASILFCFLLVCCCISENTLAYGASERDIKRMVVWIAVPKDYAGQKDLYLYSGQNPEGEFIGCGEVLYRDGEWSLMRLYVDELREDEYWIIVSTTTQGGLPDNHVGRAFPDLERTSLLPEIDTSVTSLYLEADLQEPPSGTALTISELTRIQAAGCPQFFCIFGTTETIGEYLTEIEEIFEQLILKYAMQMKGTYSDFYSVLRHVTPLCVTYGHFHDYVKLFKPLGISLEEYASMSYNRALQMFSPESNPWEPVGVILSTWCIEAPGEPDSIRAFKNDPSTILKEWGWEIYYDVSDASILEYDEFGVCITDFQFHSEGTSVNVRIPALDGSASPSGDTVFPVIGKIPGMELASAKFPEETLTPEVTKPPEATLGPEKENIIQVFPSVTPSGSKEIMNEVYMEQEDSTISLILVMAGAIVIFLGIGAFIFLNRNGKSKE